MNNNVLIVKVAKGYLKSKILPALALSTGLAGCGPNEVVSPPVTSLESRENRKPLVKRFPFLEDAKKEVAPKINELVSQYKFNFTSEKEVFNIRRWYGIRFHEILLPYYRKYDDLSSSDKKLADPKLKELEDFVLGHQQKIFSTLDEEYLKFKPWQRKRFEDRNK